MLHNHLRDKVKADVLVIWMGMHSICIVLAIVGTVNRESFLLFC